MNTKEKRHNKLIMTPEAKALREMRLEKGFSMREVCLELGKSEGFLRHIETGRRDFPRKLTVETVLQVYGATYKMFRHKVTAVKNEESLLGPKEELKRIIDDLPDHKVVLISKMIKGII